MPAFSFAETIAKLQSTPQGREASMYGPIRDLFINVLGYRARDVDIDTVGEGGRPDVTVRAESGRINGHGRPAAKMAWIVVEAKDERGIFANPVSREAVFDAKSKYIAPDTAWFVMVEPDLWVLRPVSGGNVSAASDIEVRLPISEADFRVRVEDLAEAHAGVAPLLQRFRDGDISLIGVDKLALPDGLGTKAQQTRVRVNRKRFFQEIRSGTEHLQSVVEGALARSADQRAAYLAIADDFWARYGKDDGVGGFDPHSLSLRGTPHGAAQIRDHDRAAAQARRAFSAHPSIARLAIHGLPAFQQRTGAPDNTIEEFFATETANLILARVLLLRFLEDHGFFGTQRYVCNGGVEAFQHMRTYFKTSYAELLERAYREGSRFYAAAFDETELDWIFGLDDEILSTGIEWTLFRFARYDFTTIKGDILTGIYDRFMDRDKRKRLGEFYTPPSIARYIVNHVGIEAGSRVLDPACGSGTFLIESYRKMVGKDVERGIAEYADATEALQGIAGNDLNTFSAVLAQIQLLWQVLPFKRDIEREGFPDILVTGKVNSLVESDFWNTTERFAEIDTQDYDAVVGNPPYVRAERSAQALDERTTDYFERGGISGGLNTWALFLYRALDRWCKAASQNGQAGRVGFVIQVSLFDASKMKSLRSLFALGTGRWTIREIVDLEMIYSDVFDASVYTALLIAENRPPTPDDVVSVRFANASCVHRTEAHTVPEFDLEAISESRIPYPDLFSPDGRILTRVTPQRLAILRKLWINSTWLNAAKPYWVRRERGTIVEWTADPARPEVVLWEQRRFCNRGLVFRRQITHVQNGWRIYKGENIVSCGLQEPPSIENVDVKVASDPGPWKYLDILPHRAFAIARVAHCPNAVAFDPHEAAFADTATIFVPRDDLAEVPFDLLLLSNVYVWFYAIGARMGITRALGSDVYPTNLGFLPWTEEFAKLAPEIESMRSDVISASREVLQAAEELRKSLQMLGFPTLKEHVRNHPHARLTWADVFDDPDFEFTVHCRGVIDSDDGSMLRLSDDLFTWIACSEATVAEGLALALQQHDGGAMGKKDLLNMAIPVSLEERQQWQSVVDHFNVAALSATMDEVIDRLDRLVGASLGLSDEDIDFIRGDLTSDPFLQRIRPRYPGTINRIQGFRTGLDSETRYA